MKKQGKELIFISRILRDGSGVEEITDQHQCSALDKTTFQMSRLSLTYDTWIASEFNSYVVKLKKQ